MSRSHFWPASSLNPAFHLICLLSILFGIPITRAATCTLTPSIESSTVSTYKSKGGWQELQPSYPPKYYKQKYVSNYASTIHPYDWSLYFQRTFYGNESWGVWMSDTYTFDPDTGNFTTELNGWKSYSLSTHEDWGDSYSGGTSTRTGPYDWSYPDYSFPPHVSGGSESVSTSSTTWSRTYSASIPTQYYWYGNDSWDGYESNYDSRSDEYGTMELIGRMNSALSQQSWSSWSGGMSSASYSLSQDESNVSATKVRYRFIFPTVAGVQYSLSWKIRTSWGSSDSLMSATVMGNGGQVTVGDYEISPPGQNGSVTVVDCQVSYQSPWSSWTIPTAPSLGLSVNSPGNQCIGTVVSVTANVSASNGTKSHSDSCGHSETFPLVLSSPNVTWSVTGVSASPSSGTSSTATFTPTSAGTCTVTFNATATTSDPQGQYADAKSVSFVSQNCSTPELRFEVVKGSYLNVGLAGPWSQPFWAGDGVSSKSANSASSTVYLDNTPEPITGIRATVYCNTVDVPPNPFGDAGNAGSIWVYLKDQSGGTFNISYTYNVYLWGNMNTPGYVWLYEGPPIGVFVDYGITSGAFRDYSKTINRTITVSLQPGEEKMILSYDVQLGLRAVETPYWGESRAGFSNVTVQRQH